MKKRSFGRKVLQGIYNYFMFFLMSAFLVSCTTMLFVNVLADTLSIELTNANIQTAAKLTFWNVILLSVLFTTLDTIRRKVMTEKVTKKISSAAQEIVKGDFDVRIPEISTFSADDNYNIIIKRLHRRLLPKLSSRGQHLWGYLTNWLRWLPSQGKDTGSNPVIPTSAVVKFYFKHFGRKFFH